MVVDLSVVMKNEHDIPYKTAHTNADGERVETNMTVKEVAMSALLNASEPGKTESGEEKFKRYQIAMKLKAANGSCDLPLDELATIKRLAALIWAPMVYGQFAIALESAKPAPSA